MWFYGIFNIFDIWWKLCTFTAISLLLYVNIVLVVFLIAFYIFWTWSQIYIPILSKKHCHDNLTMIVILSRQFFWQKQRQNGIFFWLFLAKIVVILKSKHLAALHHYLLIFEQYSNKLTFRKSKDKSKHKFSQRCQCRHWAFFGFQLPHFHTVSNIEFQSFAIVIVITIVTWQRLSIVKCHNNVVTMETLPL